MQTVQSDANLSYEVTFDVAGLHAAMSVYDVTASPVLVQGPTAMTNVVNATYTGKFTATDKRQYLIFKAVYLTSGFTTLDPGYSQSTETIDARDFQKAIDGAGGSGAQIGNQLTAVIEAPQTVVGLIESSQSVLGIIEMPETIE